MGNFLGSYSWKMCSKEFIDLFMNKIMFEERTKTWGKSKT